MRARDLPTEKVAKQNIMFDQVEAGQRVCYWRRRDDGRSDQDVTATPVIRIGYDIVPTSINLEAKSDATVLVQREMESGRSPLASIAPFSEGQFDPSNVGYRKRQWVETALGGPIHHKVSCARVVDWVSWLIGSASNPTGYEKNFRKSHLVRYLKRACQGIRPGTSGRLPDDCALFPDGRYFARNHASSQ